MTTRRRLLVFGLLAIAVLGGCFVAAGLNPARRSNDAIREEILAGTPLGSTEEDVDHYVKSRFAQDNLMWGKRDDGKILHVQYGRYTSLETLPFTADVFVAWHFDINHVLTRVSVGRGIIGF